MHPKEIKRGNVFPGSFPHSSQHPGLEWAGPRDSLLEMENMGTALQIKEYRGKRVVTFKDIDTVHKRPDGTASRNFRENRQRFISGVDFYSVEITNDEFRRQFGISKNAGRTITLITNIR